MAERSLSEMGVVAERRPVMADEPKETQQGTNNAGNVPIIEQSPTVDVGKRTFVILPGRLTAIPAKKLRRE